MHLRRTTALATGALLLGTPLLSGCNALDGREEPTTKVYTPAAGANNRDASVDILGAVIVSAEAGSGTFITTLVNNSNDATARLQSLAGAGADAALEVPDFDDVEVPARGLVNLADSQGLTVNGEFEAGQFVELEVGLSTNETVIVKVPVVPDGGYFAGLDTSTS